MSCFCKDMFSWLNQLEDALGDPPPTAGIFCIDPSSCDIDHHKSNQQPLDGLIFIDWPANSLL